MLFIALPVSHSSYAKHDHSRHNQRMDNDFSSLFTIRDRRRAADLNIRRIIMDRFFDSTWFNDRFTSWCSVGRPHRF